MLSSSLLAVLEVEVLAADVPSMSCVAAEKSDVDDHRGDEWLLLDDDTDDGMYAAANCVDESSAVA